MYFYRYRLLVNDVVKLETENRRTAEDMALKCLYFANDKNSFDRVVLLCLDEVGKVVRVQVFREGRKMPRKGGF